MIRVTLTDHYMTGPRSEIEDVTKKDLEKAKRDAMTYGSPDDIQELQSDVTVIVSEEAWEIYIDKD